MRNRRHMSEIRLYEYDSVCGVCVECGVEIGLGVLLQGEETIRLSPSHEVCEWSADMHQWIFSTPTLLMCVTRFAYKKKLDSCFHAEINWKHLLPKFYAECYQVTLTLLFILTECTYITRFRASSKKTNKAVGNFTIYYSKFAIYCPTIWNLRVELKHPFY